ncbi:MAG: histidine ammonia-lyase [Candidatus Muiribacteriaceae bacterium]
MKKLYIDGNSLDIDKISSFLESPTEVCLTEEAEKNVLKSYRTVQKIIRGKRPVYGITTGFGSFADVVISEEDTEALQEKLIISHAAGVGRPFPVKTVRLIMLLRVNALAKGYSGISPQTLGQLILFINRGITPVVPEYGSVGASGDLAPLSHIALALIGKGEVIYEDEVLPTSSVLDKLGIRPVRLKAKEGLALNNGTQMMSARLCESIIKFSYLMKCAVGIAAMSVESLFGSSTPFDPDIHRLRPHTGQKQVAAAVWDILKGSGIAESHINCERVQDAYTLRCIPQVYGACLDVLHHVRKIAEIEINSVTDNPLVLSEDKVVSGGNFHGEPMALNLDYLCLAVSEIANMSERRIDRMLNNSSNRLLPAFLTGNGGLNSGFMIAQYTAAALVSENKILSHPASVDSIPTSANQEDHVSMGSISAIKIAKIIENLENVLCIELLCATNALEVHKGLAPAPFSQKVLQTVRETIEPWLEDRIMYREIEKARNAINSDKMKKIFNKIILEEDR